MQLRLYSFCFFAVGAAGDLAAGQVAAPVKADQLLPQEFWPQPQYPPHSYEGAFGPHNYGPAGSVTHTSRTSAGGEIKNAGQRALLGLVLFVLAFPVLWFNEKREAHMWQLFGRAAKIARTDVPNDAVNPDNDGRMVHVTGTSSTQEVLRDSTLQISVSKCAKLKREVEMYQWVESSKSEEKDTRDGGKETITTYSYDLQWSSTAVDTSSFAESGYRNPPMNLMSETWQASKVALGAFSLPTRLVGRLCQYVDLQDGPKFVMAAGRQFTQTGPGSFATMGGAAPQLGDMKIKMEQVSCGPTTVFALQDGDSFAPMEFTTQVGTDGKAIRAQGNSEPFLTKGGKAGGEDEDPLGLMASSGSGGGGCCAPCALIGQLVEANEEVFQIAEATLTVKEIFKQAQSQQKCIHTCLQVLGFLMLWGGLDLAFQFLPALFRIIPFIGTWIQFFGNFFAHVASFLLGSFCWCVTVAIAWLAARPFKAAIFLGIAAMCVVVPTYLSHASASS